MANETDNLRGWPPGPDDDTVFVAPMFPLPEVFLFPGQVRPLHIFEPRYRRMVEDSLDRTGRLVIAPLAKPGSVAAIESVEERPEVLPLGGLGEIARFERLPGGRFLIWLLGLSRVRIEEIECGTPYRQVRAVPFEEVVPSPEEADSLRDDLRDAIASRTELGDALVEQNDVRILADVLAQLLELPLGEMSSIYSESSVAQRARRALAAHQRTAPGED